MGKRHLSSYTEFLGSSSPETLQKDSEDSEIPKDLEDLEGNRKSPSAALDDHREKFRQGLFGEIPLPTFMRLAAEKAEAEYEEPTPDNLGWQGNGFNREEIDVTRAWLRSKGNSIEGGTSEVQLNIVAKRVLGLPD